MPTKLFYDGGFNAIDAMMLEVSNKFYLIVKDETREPVKKNLRIATGDTPDGPFEKAGDPITISWIKGPSAIKFNKEFLIYFDHYATPQYYGAVKSQGQKTWYDISKTSVFHQDAGTGLLLKYHLKKLNIYSNHSNYFNNPHLELFISKKRSHMIHPYS
jgi:hypothetical protein